MTKKSVDVFEYASHICKALKPAGVLLTTASDGKVNTMTIGWGTLGVDWSRPVFIAYVRESRYTKEMLERNPVFTINIPYGSFDKKILGYCGTKSGRDTDKIADMGLHLVDSDVINVPGIREFPLTLECKVIYKEEQDLSRIPADILEHYYPTGDHHHVYYGQIVNAYLIED
jgi:flavin reductase (DIM6/NTAB) family NADH-FMN oxidoreductase RutF